MSQYKVDMASVNQKLDLLINAVMPAGVPQRKHVFVPSTDAETHREEDGGDVAVHRGVEDASTTLGRSDRSVTASGVTEELSTRTRLFHVPGEQLPRIYARACKQLGSDLYCYFKG